jgi:hypothetical protein
MAYLVALPFFRKVCKDEECIWVGGEGLQLCIDNVELFESFGGTLTQTLLTALGEETLLQLIFFHPHWVF